MPPARYVQSFPWVSAGLFRLGNGNKRSETKDDPRYSSEECLLHWCACC